MSPVLIRFWIISERDHKVQNKDYVFFFGVFVCFFQSGDGHHCYISWTVSLRKTVSNLFSAYCKDWACALRNSILWMSSIYKAGLHLMQLYLLQQSGWRGLMLLLPQKLSGQWKERVERGGESMDRGEADREAIQLDLQTTLRPHSRHTVFWGDTDSLKSQPSLPPCCTL